MATSLITVEENKELDGTKLAESSTSGSPTAPHPLVRIGSKESVVSTRSIKINDAIGEVKVHIQGECARVSGTAGALFAVCRLQPGKCPLPENARNVSRARQQLSRRDSERAARYE